MKKLLLSVVVLIASALAVGCMLLPKGINDRAVGIVDEACTRFTLAERLAMRQSINDQLDQRETGHEWCGIQCRSDPPGSSGCQSAPARSDASLPAEEGGMKLSGVRDRARMESQAKSPATGVSPPAAGPGSV